MDARPGFPAIPATRVLTSIESWDNLSWRWVLSSVEEIECSRQCNNASHRPEGFVARSFLLKRTNKTQQKAQVSVEHIVKTVFISYRRINIPWALAISQNLTHHGYDVFFDFNGISSGDFEQVIIESIKARAHFLVLLTPSALERCGDPGDWLRREIETALEARRNIVPLMLEGFDFVSPRIAEQLTGPLAALRKYNAARIPSEYFDEAMERIRMKYLNVALSAISHPASLVATAAIRNQQEAAASAPPVPGELLTAQEWFERAVYASDPTEKIELYNQVIYLNPDFVAAAFFNRGTARKANGDLAGAQEDYNTAINLDPNYAKSFYAG